MGSNPTPRTKRSLIITLGVQCSSHDYFSLAFLVRLTFEVACVELRRILYRYSIKYDKCGDGKKSGEENKDSNVLFIFVCIALTHAVSAGYVQTVFIELICLREANLPLGDLAKLSFDNLKKYEVIERASHSSLYRYKWKNAGIDPRSVESYENFTKIPFLLSKELRSALYGNPIGDILCSKVVHWFCSTGTTGVPKWIPYGKRDIELFMQIRDRTYSLLPGMNNVRGLVVSTPSPFVEDGLVGLNLIRGAQNKNIMEGVTVCVSESSNEEILNFALDIKPNVIVAFPGFAARFAEIVAEKAPQVAKMRFVKKKTAKNALLYFVTRFKKVKPKDISKFKWGLFGGEPLDPYREILSEAFGLESYEMYLFTEFMPPTAECCMHDGMHVWLDACLPEMIPEAELEIENRDPKYVPKAIPLWEASKGQRGEYVLTTFGDALPLVRYRLGDLIEVVGTERCGCGFSHPRIKVPRRSDVSAICLGSIRFACSSLDDKILSETKYGKVRKWQAEICRSEYRPKLILRVEPFEDLPNKESFVKELLGRILELEILKTGVDNGLLAEPEVLIGSFLDGGREATKAGSVVYREEK